MATSIRLIDTLRAPSADCVYREFKNKGYVVLERAIPQDVVEGMRAVWEKYFIPFSQRRPELKRLLMHVPFKAPLYDPRFVANPLVLEIADRVLGRNYVCGYFGSETPLPGAPAMDAHFDLAFWSRFSFLNKPLAFLNKFLGTVNYCYGIQVSLPLVDSNADNAPFEIWPATNRLSLRRLPPPDVLLMPAGSLLVRDIRNLHRGTAHRGRYSRPFLSLVYLRPWVPAWRPPEIPLAIYDALPIRTQKLFRSAAIGQPIPDPEAWSQRSR